jgi:dTDP-4-amino-4,6-dideoxygalactose transaminase
MDHILDIAGRHGVAVVEDNAHGFAGRYRGRPLGSFGALATLSFHETKNVSCGEGGALLVNDASLLSRAEVIRNKGTDRSRFLRGEIDKYTWVDIGSSYVLGELLAVFLLAQLEEFEQIQARRRAIWGYYHRTLGVLERDRGVRLPTVPPWCEQAYHMYYLLTATPGERTALIAHLKNRGVHAVFHYIPLHSSVMGLRLGGRVGQCPVTEDISARLVRLPFFTAMTRAEHERVAAEVLAFYRS